ncbi:DUF2213 domain-containing protein [Novacetimonas pomaceti]|uniref:DUF2213 domain-containing protein n=1 Tax=Novacetimonas pomaceti TaxID=2021998 RepID=UPI001C2CFEE3|nr:DUF2213 domain-containing protein [Novacetimonas pomaceti]MBV1833069.1 DUF2213 domain-containing protein [Novacetimonas pomaceti]
MTHAYVGDANTVSSRFEDQDGKLFVGPSVITKVGVDDYKGREIANWQGIGLDPERTYRLFRAPDELAKAAPLLRNQPILSEHAPLTADDHKSDLTIGAVGTDGDYDDGCLKASLGFWRQPYIDRIKAGTQREISMGYRFRPDMTPGVWNGQPYDGVMRDIRPNHVALVPAGRVNINGNGPEAAVADSARESEQVAEENDKPGGADALMGLVECLRAFAPDVDDDKLRAAATQLIAMLNAGTPGAEAGAGDEGGEGAGGDGNPEPGSATANDEGGDKDKKPMASDEGKTCTGDEGKDKDGTAMDAATLEAAITANLSKRFRAAREAEADVRPVVGDFSMVMDSAEEIYGAALRQKGVDTKDVDPSAYRGMWRALKPSYTRPSTNSGMAMDAATAASRTDALTRLGANRVRKLG